MDTRHTLRGYSETASTLTDEVEHVAPVDNHLQVLQSITEQLLCLQTDVDKIDAHLEAEEQKIQIQMDMEKARLAQDKELAKQRMAKDACRRQLWNFRRRPSTTLDYANFMTDRMEMRQQSGDPRPHRYWQPRPGNRPPYLSDARKEPLLPYPEENYQPRPFKHEQSCLYTGLA